MRSHEAEQERERARLFRKQQRERIEARNAEYAQWAERYIKNESPEERHNAS